MRKQKRGVVGDAKGDDGHIASASRTTDKGGENGCDRRKPVRGSTMAGKTRGRRLDEGSRERWRKRENGRKGERDREGDGDGGLRGAAERA